MITQTNKILMVLLFTGTFVSMDDINPRPTEKCISHPVLAKIADHGLSEDLPTREFLNWADGVPQLFEAIFSSQIMIKMLKYDFKNSMNTVRRVFEEDTEANAKLGDLIRLEIEKHGLERVRKSKKFATTSLLWNKRAMEFIFVFLQKLCQTEQTAKQCAEEAYAEILKPYHGWRNSTVAGKALSWTPTKTDLMESLGMTEETFVAEMNTFFRKFSRIVLAMNEILEKNEANFPDKW